MIGERPSLRTKLPVVKVKPGGSLEVVIVSEEPMTFHAHWLGDRSYMCPGVDCPACFAGVGARWHGFVCVRWSLPHGSARPMGLLELTETAYNRLDGLRRMFDLGNLYGLGAVLERRTKKSPMRAEPLDDVKRAVDGGKPVPFWVLIDAVATLYGLPACPGGEFVDGWERAAVPRASQLIRSALPLAVGR